MIWLADAALQFQPYMFTRAFVNQSSAGCGRRSAAGSRTDGRERLRSLIAGIVFVLCRVCTELHTLNAICLWCTSVHVITFFLFALVVGWLGFGSKRGVPPRPLGEPGPVGAGYPWPAQSIVTSM